jgi:hypothetical protein
MNVANSSKSTSSRLKIDLLPFCILLKSKDGTLY